MRKAKLLYISNEELQNIIDNTKCIYDENGSLVGLETNENYTNVYHIINDDLEEYELEQLESVLKNLL